MIWKIIFQAPNYSVSEYGNIKNDLTGKELKPEMHFKGYHRINLTVNKQRYRRFVHRIVAMLFVDNPENKPQVNHIDGNKTNNHYSNLEWVTNEENRQHAISTGLNTMYQEGEKHYNSKLTEEQVKSIRLYKGIFKAKKLAGMYKVSNITIYQIWARRIWKYLV